jgi:hypothetical protein
LRIGLDVAARLGDDLRRQARIPGIQPVDMPAIVEIHFQRGIDVSPGRAASRSEISSTRAWPASTGAAAAGRKTNGAEQGGKAGGKLHRAGPVSWSCGPYARKPARLKKGLAEA